MDIDSPPSLEESLPLPPSDSGLHHGHTHFVELPPLSASFPLPFRVLTLVGFAIFLWGSNLQILNALGIDPARALDFRDHHDRDPAAGVIDLDDDENAREAEKEGGSHRPVYRIGLVYSAWVLFGWIVFRLLTAGEVESMERYRGWVGVVMLGAALGALVPYRGFGDRERRALRKALRRILVPSLDSPVFFCDVILADILTSFAKVLGDFWVSSCQIWAGGITQGRVAQAGWSRYITLGMVCLPYALRFRQCLIEYHQSRYTSPRPLANALKYFSAFPVILLSALQKTVVADLALSKGISVQELKATHDRWFGEHRLFRLWLLAVVVNSMFSFYWDVEMDWGLRLCEVDTWFPKTTGTPGESPGGGGAWGRGLTSCFRRNSSSLAHQRSPCPTPTPHMRNHSRSLSDSHPHPRSLLSGPSSPTTRGRGRAWLSFGLRPVLLLPDPIVYHIFTLIDLVLRFTWSLKLSSHLHTIAEIESGVFMMEALELLRRWMWVFVRVEWEAVKQAEVRSYAQEHGLGIGVGQVIWHGEGDKDGV